ncbi:MAG: signal recognition particle protein Srp19 [Archaeoglobus sp.]|uniref:signal recognition particle subunit SRP19/SEC65 family protein n=1 Tax=Archaeoglobus sp. TaxID=1872626 RepID=UPI001D82FCC0|nr:signal recognition particle subunit SRP19/SEC65 family protein [Archaeoglobus sp.]MBO8180615.1 signal recognition particle protein Srp19 [Archaeoglobus sp.]
MKECVVWTANLDSKKSRSEGRRIPKRFAVPNVKLQELVEACKQLGLKFRAEEKKYPKSWWEEGGRVVVEKKGSKTHLMIELAKKIAEMREQKREQKKVQKKDKKKKKK